MLDTRSESQNALLPEKNNIPTAAMICLEEGARATAETSKQVETGVPDPEVRTMSRRERVQRWLIIIGSVILAIFVVYLLLILVYPSMNIGMNP